MAATMTAGSTVDVEFWRHVYEHTRNPIMRLSAAAALRFKDDSIEVAIRHLDDMGDWYETDPNANMGGTPEGTARVVRTNRMAALYLRSFLRIQSIVRGT